ncbi:hypothetical protein Zmor_015238 [Zophobas morio]|uniref:Uncharacterized protein n=1 Tax=Zophobas morio TaxID=2755281 RepID=A0AA38IHP7_9CUCU|nr:hypothetical protein Zmor_015238 [Zophobas morio]
MGHHNILRSDHAIIDESCPLEPNYSNLGVNFSNVWELHVRLLRHTNLAHLNALPKGTRVCGGLGKCLTLRLSIFHTSSIEDKSREHRGQG